MSKQNFEKLNHDELVKVSGGSVIAVIATIVPLAITAITAIANVVKMFKSTSGEVKTKDTNIKWNDESKITSKSKETFETTRPIETVKIIQPVYVAY